MQAQFSVSKLPPAVGSRWLPPYGHRSHRTVSAACRKQAVAMRRSRRGGARSAFPPLPANCLEPASQPTRGNTSCSAMAGIESVAQPTRATRSAPFVEAVRRLCFGREPPRPGANRSLSIVPIRCSNPLCGTVLRASRISYLDGHFVWLGFLPPQPSFQILFDVCRGGYLADATEYALVLGLALNFTICSLSYTPKR